MGNVWIGTSGYSYKDWLGPVYPEKLPAGEYLEFYSTLFNFTELNFSYYRQPTAAQTKSMAERVPADFLFSIKAHQSLTHSVTGNWPQDLKQFLGGVAPLAETGKLAPLIFQFPYSFHYERGNRIYLAKLLDQLKGWDTVVEFRGSDWNRDSVYTELYQRGIGLIQADYPALKGLPIPDDRSTSSTAYVRFHGRNEENWWGGTNISRYDYLYSEDELSEWLPRLQKLKAETKKLFIAFNNHHKGKAVQNGKQIAQMLET